MCHPHRHSSFYISSNVSFYITFSKIPIKASVKYCSYFSFLPSSFTFHFYLIHQFPSFSVFSLFLPNKPQLSYNIVTKSIFRIERYKRPTDIADRHHHHHHYPTHSLPIYSHPDISIKHPQHTLIRLGTP